MKPSAPKVSLELASPEATAALGRFLAGIMGPGDTLLLSGQLGSGKTLLARALIQSRLGPAGAETDVPSPSFTLVQTYAGPDTEIWHADLYRLCDVGDLIELGLDEAFGTALCIVEWPERLDAMMPPDALHVTLSHVSDDHPDLRQAHLHGARDRWGARLRGLQDAVAEAGRTNDTPARGTVQ